MSKLLTQCISLHEYSQLPDAAYVIFIILSIDEHMEVHYLNLHSHLWLVAITLDSAALVIHNGYWCADFSKRNVFSNATL